MNTTLKTLTGYVTALLIAGIFTAGYVSVSFANQKQQAVQGCLQTSVYRSQRTEDGIAITTEEPIEAAVRKCLDLQNIK